MQWQEFWELHRKTILIVLGGVALLIGGWLYSRPAPANPTFATAVSTKPAAVDKSKAATTPAKVCVDVKGAVNRPGVYTLGKMPAFKKRLQQQEASIPMQTCARSTWPSSCRISRSSMFQLKANSCQAV